MTAVANETVERVIGAVEGPVAHAAGHPRRYTLVRAPFLLDRIGGLAPGTVLAVVVTAVHTAAARGAAADAAGAVPDDAEAARRLAARLRDHGLAVEAVDAPGAAAAGGVPEEAAVVATLAVSGEDPGAASLASLPPADAARALIGFDRHGATRARGHGEDTRFGDGAGHVAELAVDAPLAEVWRFATDLGVPARYSDEATGATWDGPARGVGATFTGSNENRYLGAWQIACFVDVWDEPDGDRAAFGWATTDPANPGATWRYELTRLADGTTWLRHSVTLGPGPSGLTIALEQMPDREARIVSGRLKELAANMARTVRGIKALAEGGAG